MRIGLQERAASHGIPIAERLISICPRGFFRNDLDRGLLKIPVGL